MMKACLNHLIIQTKSQIVDLNNKFNIHLMTLANKQNLIRHKVKFNKHHKSDKCHQHFLKKLFMKMDQIFVFILLKTLKLDQKLIQKQLLNIKVSKIKMLNLCMICNKMKLNKVEE